MPLRSGQWERGAQRPRFHLWVVGLPEVTADRQTDSSGSRRKQAGCCRHRQCSGPARETAGGPPRLGWLPLRRRTGPQRGSG